MRNISFIIICPLLGYRKGCRKFLQIKHFQEMVKKISSSFTAPDIVAVTGLYNKEYLNIKSGFRIVENQIPFDTGEIEQIRLGINNITNNKIVIIKEECSFDCNVIKTGIKTSNKFLIHGINEGNPGMIINDNLVNNISFGLKNYFGDMLYVSNIEEIKEFIEKPHNRNKKLYELVNHLINIEPIKIL
jgi:hypothetical protein